MRMNTLTLTDDEARLLLSLTTQHADGLEFEIDPAAQRQAFDAWLLAGKISDLLEPPSAANA
jgi:hypothetical protein